MSEVLLLRDRRVICFCLIFTAVFLNFNSMATTKHAITVKSRDPLTYTAVHKHASRLGREVSTSTLGLLLEDEPKLEASTEAASVLEHSCSH